MINRLAWFFLLCFIILAPGCASLMNYSRHTQAARSAMSQGAYAQALADFPEKAVLGNMLLNHLERGAVLQAMGEFQASAREFQAAAGKINAYENRAVISATRTASGAASLLINEQVRAYEGKDFEKVLLHTLNALNYLLQGDLEGARVEIRNAYRRQQELAEKHAKALEEARRDPRSKGWEDALKAGDAQRYERLRQTADSVRNVYQNAFAYYVSAVVYEWGGEADEAYIDLKKANEALPGCPPVQRDLLRLAGKLHFVEDISRWEKEFGRAAPAPAPQATDVFVIFASGMAPAKEAAYVPILTGSGMVSAAFPVYRFTPSFIQGGVVTAGTLMAQTALAADVDALAARTLLDEFPLLFIKQVARTAIKGYAVHGMQEKHDAFGAFLASVFAVITEQADLRTWSMLPKQLQVARFFVPGDTRTLSLAAVPAGGRAQVNIPEGSRRVVILARAIDSGLSVQAKSF